MMTNDIYLVVGMVVLILSIPSILSAILEGRAPRFAAIILLIGGGLVYIAISRKPGGYRIEEIPDVFVRVVGHLIN